jgi:dipeptidyl aminopeptidase/acylaminoacyl peptidase
VIEAPYGSWPSPISAAMLVEGAARIDDVVVDRDGTLYWSEARPAEGGRCVVVRRDRDGAINDVTPIDHNVRTRVHEYGGGAWHVQSGCVAYSNFRDQRLWCIDDARTRGEPRALTPEPTNETADRFADGRFTPDGTWYVCVRERHIPRVEASNELVAVATDGSQRVTVLASGADFYSAPRVSTDGARLAWVQWNHPDMPWDRTELWVADLVDGAAHDAQRVAGDGDEAIVQPEWSSSGWLYFCSDRNEWWNLYRWRAGWDAIEPVVIGPFEIATPPWGFGQSRYLVSNDGVHHVRGLPGRDVLVELGGDVSSPSGTTAIDSLATDGQAIVFVGASYDSEPAIYRVEDGGIACIHRARELALDARFLTAPAPITFASGGAVAHALFYAPASATHIGPTDEKAPLIVMAHGGPTGAARTQLNLALRYWTSRGFAVVDVDYRGSTGYGRTYRRALDGAWGVADVDDCIAAARHLVAEGLVDGDRLAIRGGSAGGFTVLAALAFHPGVFQAGASHYGIADLEALARDTHKFESRYLDRLVGPYPEARDVYRARSPIHHLERLATPLIVLQGLEDQIVPPNQAQMIVDALAARGLAHAYLTFEGEGHGFRQGPNIIRALEAEAYFYSRVFGFELADPVPPITIGNL